MITSFDILKKLPSIDPAEAEKMASEINLLAVKYDIDSDEIINLLDMKPKDLEQKINEVKIQREELKRDLRDKLLME